MVESSTEKTTSIRVWDLPTRVFHWTLVVLVVLGWITGEAGDELFWTHLGVGYAVLALVVFRLAWGVLGTRHARFSDFVHPWPAVRDQALSLLRLSPSRHVGHNPLGGWMIVALLTVLSLLIGTGLFAGEEGEAGPWAHIVEPWLADGLEEVHEVLNAVLWGLIAAHVAGVLVDSLLAGENLVRAMWTGEKNISVTGDTLKIEKVGIFRLATSLILAAAAVVVVVW
ncbi:MAG: cytochrome b/b6 domain-containing protein [Rhodospirillales bacterium]|nr:cytochrome b/b6 domain-containing protein [Rhodospirillales bacterium]